MAAPLIRQASPEPAESPADYISSYFAESAARLRAEGARPQRRLFLIGLSGSGKTYSTVTTCPKPIVVDWDNQLNDPAVRSALHGFLPMWDTDWVKAKFNTPDKLAALHTFLSRDCTRLDTGYTVIHDSCSMFGDFLMDYLLTKKPKSEDNYWLWREWSKEWRRFCTALQGLPCNSVLIAHERGEKTNEMSAGKPAKEWLMQGREFTPRIPSFFTDVALQLRETTPDITKGTVKVSYLWQVQPDMEFAHAKTRLKTDRLCIPASWAELTK